MAGSFDDNLVYISRLLEGILDKQSSIDPMSQSAYNKLLDNFSAQIGKLNDASNVTKAELKNIIAYFKTFVSSYDLKSTEFNKTVQQLQRSLEGRMAGGEKLNVDKLLKGLSNLFTSAVLQSIKAEERGKTGTFKNVVDNEKLQAITKDLAQRMGVQSDASANKIIEFFKEQEKKREKKQQGYIDDLVDALGRSKWIGGVLQDILILGSLMVADFFQKLGPWGRVVGGTIVAGMLATAPVIANLLLKGISKLVTQGVPALLKGLAGLLVRASTAVGGPLSMFSPGRWAMMTGAGKAASVGRLAGAAGASIALGAGSIWAGKEAVNSFKQGDKVGGGAFGVGALGLGIAAIAAVVAGIAAPVTLIAAAVGGIAVGVGLLWKNREKVMEHFKKNEKFYSKLLGIMDFLMPGFAIIRRALEWVVDNWPFGKGDTRESGLGGVTGGAVGSMLSAVDSAKGGYFSYGKMKVSKRTGAVLNLHELTQDEASEALQAYEKDKPKLFHSVYEWLDKSHASFGSHSTDAVMKQNGNVTGVLSYAGASKDIDEARAYLIAQGVPPEVANSMVQTSGKATGSNKFHKKGAGNGWFSHFNEFARATDLGGLTEAQWLSSYGGKSIFGHMQDFYASKGFKATYEKEGQGASTGPHTDLKPSSTGLPLDSIQGRNLQERLAEQKAKKEEDAKAVISAGDLLKVTNEAKYNQVQEEIQKKIFKGEIPKQQAYEKALLEEGIFKGDLPGKPWMHRDTATGALQPVVYNDGVLALSEVPGNNGFFQKLIDITCSGTGGN